MASVVLDLAPTFLPIGHMRQITRVTSLAGASAVGEVELSEHHWVYAEHFPGDPIFPGTLLIEAAGQLVALWAWARGDRGRPRLVRTSAEFLQPVTPAVPRLTLKAEVRRKRHVTLGTVRIWAGETEVATVEALLVVLPPAQTSPFTWGRNP